MKKKSPLAVCYSKLVEFNIIVNGILFVWNAEGDSRGKLDNLLISNGYGLEKFIKANIICSFSVWFVKENKHLKTMF